MVGGEEEEDGVEDGGEGEEGGEDGEDDVGLFQAARLARRRFAGGGDHAREEVGEQFREFGKEAAEHHGFLDVEAVFDDVEELGGREALAHREARRIVETRPAAQHSREGMLAAADVEHQPRLGAQDLVDLGHPVFGADDVFQQVGHHGGIVGRRILFPVRRADRQLARLPRRAEEFAPGLVFGGARPFDGFGGRGVEGSGQGVVRHEIQDALFFRGFQKAEDLLQAMPPRRSPPEDGLAEVDDFLPLQVLGIVVHGFCHGGTIAHFLRECPAFDGGRGAAGGRGAGQGRGRGQDRGGTGTALQNSDGAG